jgi:DNA-binding response OmpR family regulator
VVEDRWVSRYHAEVRREGQTYTVHDLGSKNGTYVNGYLISAPHPLADGDQISVAPLHLLTFVDYAVTAPLPGQKVRPLDLIPETRDVRVRGQRLHPPLSQVQYDFLSLLMSESGRAYNRDEVVLAVWPDEAANGISDDAINALVHRLRLRELESKHDFIVTVRGYGFRLELP